MNLQLAQKQCHFEVGMNYRVKLLKWGGAVKTGTRKKREETKKQKEKTKKETSSPCLRKHESYASESQGIQRT